MSFPSSILSSPFSRFAFAASLLIVILRIKECLLLDVIAMSGEEGAGMQIWEATDGETQIWKMSEVKPEGEKKAAKKPAAKKTTKAKRTCKTK